MSFEITLVGSFPAGDEQLLKDVQNRLTLNTESSIVLHREEYEFVLEVSEANRQPVQRTDGSSLRAKRDLTVKSANQSPEWTLQTYSKPIRSFTTTLVRPCVVIPLTTGDVHAFVSAIGYRTKEVSIRKGWLFNTSTSTTISLFQVTKPTSLSDPVSQHASRWYLEVITVVTPAQPKNMQVPVADTLKDSSQQIASVAVLMKGLVDLKPPEY